MSYALCFALMIAFTYLVVFVWMLGTTSTVTETTTVSTIETMGSVLRKVVWIAFQVVKNFIYLYVVVGCFMLTRWVVLGRWKGGSIIG